MNDIQKRRRGRPRTRSPQSVQASNTASPSGQLGPVQALHRGIVILKLLSVEGAQTLSDIALQVALPVSTVHRNLITLQQHGLVQFDDMDQTWTIGIECFRIGSTFLRQTNLLEAARSPMKELTEATGETSNLGIINEGQVVFVTQVESHAPIRAFFRPGTRSSMHASGIGKALLSVMSKADVQTILKLHGLEKFTDQTLNTSKKLFPDLATSNTRGWAFDDQEHYPGMRCVASAIFNAAGEPIAGVSVSGPTIRFTDTRITELGQAVQTTAAKITRSLGRFQ